MRYPISEAGTQRLQCKASEEERGREGEREKGREGEGERKREKEREELTLALMAAFLAANLLAACWSLRWRRPERRPPGRPVPQVRPSMSENSLHHSSYPPGDHERGIPTCVNTRGKHAWPLSPKAL